MLDGLNRIDQTIKRLDKWVPPKKSSQTIQEQELWKPLPGPQTMAYFSEADELFYGGAAGGGKSDLILGLALTAHQNSIIFRREYPQLKGLLGRCKKILKGTGARYNATEKTWSNLPSDRSLEFGACQHEDDVEKFQGRPHDLKCVGAGTPVWMADGIKKPIEQIQVGDRVLTLDGVRRVTEVYHQVKPAVLVKAFIKGQLIGSQVQSCSHEVLTDSGLWASHDTFYAPLLSSIFSPTLCRVARHTSKLLLATYEAQQRVREHQYLDLGLPKEFFQCLLDRQSMLGLSVCKAQLSQENDCGLSYDGLLNALLPFLLPDAPLKVSQACRDQLESCFSLLSTLHDGFDAHIGSLSANLRDGYWCDRIADDALPHPVAKVVLVNPLQLSDAEQQIPNGLKADVQDTSPKRTHRKWSYVHPYTKEIRQTDLEVHVSSNCEFVNLGLSQLYDLTVEDSNHYITGAGFVNRNCIDEITHFSRSQFKFLTGWLRTDDPLQRCRVICTGNPPTTAEGRWVIEYWAPWLDPKHPNPAAPGELRWFAVIDGKEIEVESGEPFCSIGESGKEEIKPRSRTFIPAKIEDNPIYMKTGYKSVLQSLPEPLRSQMLRGDFAAGVEDDPWQVIPTEWILAAQERSKRGRPPGVAQTCIACDPARGGACKTVIAPRYGNYIDTLLKYPGKSTPDGPAVASLIQRALEPGAIALIDVCAIGSSPYDFCIARGLSVYPLSGADKSNATDKSGKFGFSNKRAEWHWRLREALDPNSGEDLALPMDPEVLADLTAPRWRLTSSGKIQIEEKEEIKKRIGRSPDCGDVIIYSLAEPEIAVWGEGYAQWQ